MTLMWQRLRSNLAFPMELSIPAIGLEKMVGTLPTLEVGRTSFSQNTNNKNLTIYEKCDIILLQDKETKKLQKIEEKSPLQNLDKNLKS